MSTILSQKNTFLHVECVKPEVMPRRSRSTSDLTDTRFGVDFVAHQTALKRLEEISDDASTDVSEVGVKRDGSSYWVSDSDDSQTDSRSTHSSDAVEFEMAVDEAATQQMTQMNTQQMGSPLMVAQQMPQMNTQQMGSPQMFFQQASSPQLVPQQVSSPQMFFQQPQMNVQQMSSPQQNPLGFVCLPIVNGMISAEGGLNPSTLAQLEQLLQMGAAPVQQQQQEQQVVNQEKAQGKKKNADYTIMLRNIPNKYTQDMLLDHLNKYRGSIDFLYLPTDFKNNCNLGYAFINFVDMNTADIFTKEYQGGRLPHFRNSPKVLAVGKARVQGASANIKRFRSSSVMGVLSEDAKPMLFQNGMRIPFPKPLKALPPVGPRYIKETA